MTKGTDINLFLLLIISIVGNYHMGVANRDSAHALCAELAGKRSAASAQALPPTRGNRAS